jgi:hypothetical protein
MPKATPPHGPPPGWPQAPTPTPPHGPPPGWPQAPTPELVPPWRKPQAQPEPQDEVENQSVKSEPVSDEVFDDSVKSEPVSDEVFDDSVKSEQFSEDYDESPSDQTVQQPLQTAVSSHQTVQQPLQTAVSVYVMTPLGASIEDEEILENVLNRVQERGCTLSMCIDAHELFLRMKTPAQLDRVFTRLNDIKIMQGSVTLRLDLEHVIIVN